MADSFAFELVSPERRLAAADAAAVTIPGVAGDLTAMPNHAPYLTTLRPGTVTVTSAGGSVTRYFVSGGFAEVSPTGVSILAEEASEAGALPRDLMDRLVADAERALATVAEDGKAAAALRLNDLRFAAGLAGG
jgi:F-type H+-transporting ATPase subunit epsilon